MRCEEQFFRISNFAYGLQFHVETTRAMIDNWINEDKEFVLEGLGPNGQSILKEEDRKYSDKTFLKRKFFINKLFELLET